jgi:hypothetical protein
MQAADFLKGAAFEVDSDAGRVVTKGGRMQQLSTARA